MTFKNILIATCFISLSATAIAQPMRASRPEYSLKVAEESEAANDYYNALEYYEKYYEQGKDRAIAYKIANLHMLLRDYAKAETWFARVLLRDKKATGEENPEARYYLGMMQKMTGKYEESIYR
jgi:tetratricopeptide (TPR) repeat protein